MDPQLLEQCFADGEWLANLGRTEGGMPALPPSVPEPSSQRATTATTPRQSPLPETESDPRPALPPRRTTRRRRRPQWPGWCCVVAGLLLLCVWLFMRGLPRWLAGGAPERAAHPGGAREAAAEDAPRIKKIADIRVGDRVLTTDPNHQPRTDDDPLLGGPTARRIDQSDITREGWRCLDLRIDHPDGSAVRVQMLRPLWWLEEIGVRAGGTIELRLLELEIQGPAKVLRIGPCEGDSRENGPGTQIVTATLRHENAEVWDLTFEGQAAPLGVTARHPLYSHDRHAWVAAAELWIGERVTAVGGSARLLAKAVRPGRHTVYNLEVHRTHAFYVTEVGLLAHNNPLSGEPATPPGGKPPGGTPPTPKRSAPIQPGSKPGTWVVNGKEYPTFEQAAEAAGVPVKAGSAGKLPSGYNVTKATPTEYEVVDAANPELFVAGGVKDGRLRFNIQAIDPETGARGTVRGQALFDGMMEHFGSTVKVIEGRWNEGTNLAEFNRLTGQGVSLEEAASRTWTGQQAARYGFTKVTVETKIGSAGRFGEVIVRFEKPK
jgi:hypothetical protein